MKTNYRLIDTGNGRRLERFGDLLIIRPEKQALWEPGFDRTVWEEASLIFDDGSWNREVSDLHFEVFFSDIKFDLRPMGAGQLGVFPEQEASWAWLREVIASSEGEVNIMNGFAFTGGSTLFSSTSKTAVCHIDGSNGALRDARRNALISGKEPNSIRWINDDVISFMQREIRRGREYRGFIFDPPAFGRGRGGREWKLKRDLPRLFDAINDLSGECPEFVLITVHDPSLSATTLLPLFAGIDGIEKREVECGTLELKAESGRNLKGGFFARWDKGGTR